MAKVLGIKLGTDSSAVAVMENGKPVAIKNHEGSYVTPSVIAYTKDGTCLIGHLAKQHAVANLENTFEGVMRLIGRSYAEVAEMRKQFSYQILNCGGDIRINCPVLQQQFTPEELLAKVLHQLAEDASQFLGEPTTQIVLEVPTGFGLAERLACQEAARIAGLDLLRIIDSGAASAIAYGVNQESNETIMVFELEAGHLGVSAWEIGNGVFAGLASGGDPQVGGSDFDHRIVNWLMDIIDKSGDPQVGGSDFDHRVVNWLMDIVGKSKATAFRSDPQAFRYLIEVAEAAKHDLTEATETKIYLPNLAGSTKAPPVTLTRNKFEELCSDLIDRCRTTIKQVLRDSERTADKIDHVFLIGGATRMPAVHRLIQEIFNKEPSVHLAQDELFATGVAIQAGVLTGEVKDVLLLDMMPFSLGIEIEGGAMRKMLPHGTTIPTKKSEVFSTAIEGQSKVEIHVLEGEREMAKDNKSLCTFYLEGIPPAPRGVPQVEVTFGIDANHLLTVIAKDKGTGKEQAISITKRNMTAGQHSGSEHSLPSHGLPCVHRSSFPTDVNVNFPPISPFPTKTVADWDCCPYCKRKFSPRLQADAKICPLCQHPLGSPQPFKPFKL